jgi:multiple sugar transport system permease protein
MTADNRPLDRAVAGPDVVISGGRISKGRRRRFGRSVTPYLFLSPFLLVFALFVVFPLLYALYISLYRTKLVGGRSFVGLDNYVKAINDPALWTGIWNVLTFGIIQVPIMLGIALAAALILDQRTGWRSSLYRLVYFLPFAVPGVVAALIWGYLYGQSFGPIAQIARAIGVAPPQFLSQSSIIPALANVSTWQYTGYNMLILYAALKAIPTDLYDAARVDGASSWQTAWRIRIPLIFPAIVLTTIFSIIGTFQLFGEPRVLAAIAPSVIGPNFTPNLYVYQLAFANRNFEYSAAIAFTLAFITAVLSGIVLFVVYRRARE